MTKGVFNPKFEDLPRVIPIFPLTGALLLPTGKLPLNIFEPRYLAMVRDALADDQRIIGMLQPRVPDMDDNWGTAGDGDDEPVLYKTGCAGRITSFAESEDGRYLLTLSGVCRFDIAEEMTGKEGYRRVLADFQRFRDDVADPGLFFLGERFEGQKTRKQYCNWQVRVGHRRSVPESGPPAASPAPQVLDELPDGVTVHLGEASSPGMLPNLSY